MSGSKAVVAGAAGKAGGRPRGRRPTFDRSQAVEIALGLFWRHGYDGVGIAELTRAIGVAAPSLYHAFGSKAGLFREALRRYHGLGLEPGAVAGAPTALEAVRRVLEHGVAAATRDDRPAGCLVSSGLLMTSPDNAALAAELRADRAALRTALERRIRQDAEAGLLDAGTDPAGLARFYAGVLQGLSVQAIDGAGPGELGAVVRHALDAWPGALRRPAARTPGASG